LSAFAGISENILRNSSTAMDRYRIQPFNISKNCLLKAANRESACVWMDLNLLTHLNKNAKIASQLCLGTIGYQKWLLFRIQPYAPYKHTNIVDEIVKRIFGII